MSTHQDPAEPAVGAKPSKACGGSSASFTQGLREGLSGTGLGRSQTKPQALRSQCFARPASRAGTHDALGSHQNVVPPAARRSAPTRGPEKEASTMLRKALAFTATIRKWAPAPLAGDSRYHPTRNGRVP
jgi:hypothetical protein